jgi:hypothetical protein
VTQALALLLRSAVDRSVTYQDVTDLKHVEVHVHGIRFCGSEGMQAAHFLAHVFKSRQFTPLNPVDAINRARQNSSVEVVFSVQPLREDSSPPVFMVHAECSGRSVHTIHASNARVLVHEHCPGLFRVCILCS